MSKVSVISVTYNNAYGLTQTLESVANLRYQPKEIIVVDGQSSDGTSDVVLKYKDVLNIIFVSEEDDGIYHAMNKGLLLASGDLVHYLNAGDTVYGEPYCEVNAPCLLPVKLVKEDFLGFAKPTVAGRSYCHQGIIFPSSHHKYDQRYAIAADFFLVLETFDSVTDLPINSKGGVCYDLSGVSATRKWQRDKEMILILLRKRCWLLFLQFSFMALLKSFLPKGIRQRLYKRRAIK